jgi:hypothetical protein
MLLSAQIINTVAEINKEEKHRNRNRVLEVSAFFKQTKVELEQLDEMAHN